MNLERVRTHFEDEAQTYVDHILKFVPEYQEQNELMMRLVPFRADAPIRVLDLGSGPGVLSGMVLARWPNAQAHLFDLAENMIMVARGHLAEYGGRATFQVGNFGTEDFGTGYDLVVSGLSIHHLDDDGKQRLFRKLFAVMKPGGAFLNRDIVRGATDRLSAEYDTLWCEFVRAHNEDDKALLHRFHAEDVPASVESQLGWLREAGFADVGCHYQRLNFAVYGGRKPPVEDRDS